MSCPCTLRLFIRTFASLELESPLTRRAVRNLRPVPRRQFTGTTRCLSAASAVADSNTTSTSNRSQDEGSSKKPAGSPLATGAVMDLADLTDDAIDSLLQEEISFSFAQEPDVKKKRKPRDGKRIGQENVEDSEYPSPAKPLKIRRPGARTEEETKELRIHYSSNPNWSSDNKTKQPQYRSEGNIRYESQAEDNGFAPKKKISSRSDGDDYTPESKSVIRPERDSWTPKEREPWQIQKAALKEKLGGEAWNPRKRLSPDAIEGIRALNAQFPDQYNTASLAAQFEVSPEAIRRILKSKWRPNDEEEEDRKERWFKRGKKVWERHAELGMKPPKQWRMEGVDRRDGEVPVWDRKKRRGREGGGIIIKRGLKAGDVQGKVGGDAGEDWL